MPPPFPAKPKTKTAKAAAADVARAPDDDRDGVRWRQERPRGAKRRKQHAERATEVGDLCGRPQVPEEAFEKAAAAKKWVFI